MATVIDPAGIAALFGPTGPVGREVARITNRVRNEIVRRTPVDTGRMRAGWAQKVTYSAERVTGEVYNDVFYTGFHVSGTGIYGPTGTPIRPTTRTYMRFRSRATGEWVFAKEVRGIRPNPFVRDGFRAGVAGSGWPIEWVGP